MYKYSLNHAAYEIKRKKFGTVGQATDDNTIERVGIASWLYKTVDIFNIYNSHCSFTVPVVTRMRLKITLICTLPLLFNLQSLCNMG